MMTSLSPQEKNNFKSLQFPRLQNFETYIKIYFKKSIFLNLKLNGRKLRFNTPLRTARFNVKCAVREIEFSLLKTWRVILQCSSAFYEIIGKMLLNLKLFLLLIALHQVHCFRDNDLTAEIPAGRRECYYQTTKSGHNLEIEYQVSCSVVRDLQFKTSV